MCGDSVDSEGDRMKVYLVRKNGRYLDSMFSATGMDTAPTLQRCAIFIGRESAQVVAERCGGEVVGAIRTTDNKLEVLS